VPSSKQKFRERSAYVRLQVGQRFIVWRKSFYRDKSSRKDYRKGDARSSSNWLSAAPAKLRPRWITAAATATKHLDGFWRAPVERRRADWNPATPAEFCARGILVPATRTNHCTGRQRRGLHLTRDWLKSRIAAPSAELHTFREPRLAFGAHHDGERRRMCSMFAVETAAARGRQLIARHADL
jgi:hypothetical protein